MWNFSKAKNIYWWWYGQLCVYASVEVDYDLMLDRYKDMF